MPTGSIVGIRGSLLKHFVTPWQGQRYSVVHFFKESFRRWPPKKDRTKDCAIPEAKLKMRTGIRTLASAKIDLKERNVLRGFGKYISLETAKTVILAVFPRGFEFVYGSEAGQRCTNSLANNIGKYTESQPPPTVLDCRHAHHEWWLKLDGNEHFWSPKGSCGVYHWDTCGTCSGVLDGAYAVRLRRQLIQSFGVMTRAVDLLFRIIDNPMREQYHMAWKKLQPAVKVSTTKDELFTLRAVLINVLTEEHIG
ncbi:MAG: hypothetical protein M1813_005639 [Trichoglossum hirsutum]|nr:MAG: hypothetical protein M1813_005639 [Trichoglossum hirsutum]